MWQAEVRVDLDAIRDNVAALRARTTAELMAVVKADGYGHGMVPAARAALAGGATWLGVATLAEALQLREAGLAAPVLAWLHAPGMPLHEGVAADVDLSAAGLDQLAEAVTAARRAERAARVHLKIDTGLGRGGAAATDWPALLEAAAKAQAGGEIDVVGVWSHFASADVPGDESVDRQLAAFAEGLAVAERCGISPRLRHIANSAALLTRPDAHYDLVRAGIAIYGLPPVEGDFGVRPAMTARARVSLVKRVPAGQGVSYGLTYHTERESTLALIPIGYGDGVPRHASNGGPVAINGRVHRIAGRVCMDQIVLDCGDDPVAAGDVATLFGPDRPTADDWAEACGTINYEIVTRFGGSRVSRLYDGGGHMKVNRRRAKQVGIIGAVVGVAAAGLATAFAVERALVRKSVNAPGDPYRDEEFGDQPCDEQLTVTAADGTQLHVEVVEPREGAGKPTIVFVHGFALDMGTFYFQRQKLTSLGEHRMVFYDQPGHGRSSRLKSGDYDIAALGKSLAAVLNATVPDGHIILVGHSMGGMTIMAFAEQFPEWFGNRVTGVVLISTSAGLIDKTKLGLPTLVARASAPFFPVWNRAAGFGGSAIDRARVASSDLAWLLTRRYGFGDDRPSPSLVTFVEQMNSKTSVETLTKYLHTLYTHNRFPALSALRGVPVLVIVGTKDYLTPVTHSEQILKHLPEAVLVKVDNSGHVVMLEKADEVNAAILPFLDKIS